MSAGTPSLASYRLLRVVVSACGCCRLSPLRLPVFGQMDAAHIINDCCALAQQREQPKADIVPIPASSTGAAAQAYYRFCPYCAAPLVERFRHGASRPVCAACGFIQFSDPKVAVVGFVTRGDQVLLIRRGVAPAKGLWALPGGFMDAGELPGAALARELAEETGLRTEIGPLLALYPLVGSRGSVTGIVLCYAATVAQHIDPRPGDDVDEARWFGAHELPAELAFASTQELLNQWLGGLAAT